MGIFNEIRTQGATHRLTEEELYAEALREIESGQRRDGIWAKALAESEMDHGKAGAKYIKLRVQSMKDEITFAIAEARRSEAEAKKTQQQIEQNNRNRLLESAKQAKIEAEQRASVLAAEKYYEEQAAREKNWVPTPIFDVVDSILKIAPVVAIVYGIIWYYKKYY